MRNYLRRLAVVTPVVIGGLLVFTVTPGGLAVRLAVYGVYAALVIGAVLLALRLGIWRWDEDQDPDPLRGSGGSGP